MYIYRYMYFITHVYVSSFKYVYLRVSPYPLSPASLPALLNVFFNRY